MSSPPSRITRLIDAFKALPGIGPKTAERFVYYLLRRPTEELTALADAIQALKKDILTCTVCRDIAEQDPCPICADGRRNHGIIAVVATSPNLHAIERAGQFSGVYHVLGGVINPIDGVTANDLTIDALEKRIRSAQSPVTEVILALNPDLEGETTALEVAKRLRPLNITVSRIARGLPVGGDIEYADDVTLKSAIDNRRPLG